jgi:hypothetical protein
VGTGNGDPEVPKLPSVQGYSWASLSPGDINWETWSSRLEVGCEANNSNPGGEGGLNIKKPEVMPAGRSWRGIVKVVKGCGTTEEGEEEETGLH